MLPYIDSYTHVNQGAFMNAVILNYLYEDLPEKHIVLATEWNDAMQQIKNAINNHASLINKTIGVPFVTFIGTEDFPWIGSPGAYTCIITQQEHQQGLTPKVQLFDINGDVFNADYALYRETGNIKFYSSANKIFRIIIQ